VGQNAQVVDLLATNGTPNNTFNATNMVLAGGNLNVGNGGTNTFLRVGMRSAFTPGRTNDPVDALLDVSKQTSFTANVGTVSMGIQGDGGNTCVGRILLATNNTIITTFAGGIMIGDSTSAGNGASLPSTMTLGAGTNLIDSAILTVGGAKTSGLMTLPVGGLLVLTNSGSGRANLTLANNTLNTSGNSRGTNDFSGGTVIASVDQLIVGRKSGGGAGGATGLLTLSTNAANQVNAKDIFLGYMIGGSGTATGILTIGGGSVLVTNVTLGFVAVAGSGNSAGILNLNGGTFSVAGAITNGLGSGTINMTNATLITANPVGTLAAPVTKLAITNSILQFGASSVISNFAVSNLVAGGTANTIRIASAPTNNYSATLPLISYVNFSGTNNFQPDFTILSNTYSSLSFSGSIITNNNVVLVNLTIANITTTTLNALTASTYGQSVTFTATVSGTPTGGTVQFYDNGVALASPVPVISGQAQLTTSTLIVSGHPITAAYSGTTGFTPSTTASASTQTVSRATPVLTAPAAATISAYGQALTNATLSGGAATNNWNNVEVTGSFAYTAPATVPGAGTAAQGVT
ncbi:MAG: Ig-like domain-containing protein, partial [Verrucomicrobiota bacterium]